ncbi:MAG: serine hydrolase [Candidatus Aminicenantes bacterium]|nr:serine hydrolase [Candidatus Aminicenantes bacterium]
MTAMRAKSSGQPLVLLLLVLGLAAGVSSGCAVRPTLPSGGTAAVFPEASWERIHVPEAAGYSREGIVAALDKLRSMTTTALVAVADGRILFDYGNTAELSYLASVRKSVLAILYGIYVERGKIDLAKTLADLNITDVGGLSPQELEATVSDLLAARSGVYHPASNPGDNLADAPPRGSQKHGAYFLYSNWDFNALGTIFEQETGAAIYDALEADLVRPLGMEDFRRDLQRKSGNLEVSEHPAYHMWLSTRDMARVGLLMLREGRWRGKQIVSRAWVRKITSPVTRNTEMNPAGLRNGRWGYGYLWWVFDGPAARGPYAGGFSGQGAGGQYITVLPAIKLVVAHKLNTATSKPVSSRDYFDVVDLIVRARLR